MTNNEHLFSYKILFVNPKIQNHENEIKSTLEN